MSSGGEEVKAVGSCSEGLSLKDLEKPAVEGYMAALNPLQFNSANNIEDTIRVV